MLASLELGDIERAMGRGRELFALHTRCSSSTTTGAATDNQRALRRVEALYVWEAQAFADAMEALPVQGPRLLKSLNDMAYQYYSERNRWRSPVTSGPSFVVRVARRLMAEGRHDEAEAALRSAWPTRCRTWGATSFS
jgi:hypothetical protein